MDVFIFLVLLITSIVAVAFIVERGLALRREKVIPEAVSTAVMNYRSAQDLDMLRGVCDHYPSATSRLLVFSSEHLDWPRHENVEVLETRARHEISRLERGLVILEIIVGIAPLMGLVGTIYGLIILFGDMSAAKAGDHTWFAAGVGVALKATLMGLLIAIIALIGWTFLSKRVENMAVEMENICDEFLRRHYRNEDPALAGTRIASSIRRR